MKVRLVITIAVVALVAAACGVAHPWPDAPTPHAESHTVLAIGDSLLGQTDYSMVDRLNHAGFTATTVIDAHVNGSGLVSPVPFTEPDGTVTTYPSALAWVQHNVEAHPEADTVVMEYVGACWNCDLWLPEPQSYVYGSPGFYSAWEASARSIVDYLHSQGKLVVWAVSPRIGASGGTIASGSQLKSDVAVQLSHLDRDVLCPLADGCADWWTPLVDLYDNYQTLLNYDGGWHKVRSDDLVHLELDGSIRTATWTVTALDTLWAAHLPTDASTFAAPQPTHLITAGDAVVIGLTGSRP